MFGDSDIYTPDENYADWESDNEEEANEWFDSYTGFEDEINSSRKTIKSEVVREMYADDGCLIQIIKLPDGKYKVTDNWQTEDICDNLHDAQVMFNDYLG